MAYNLATVRNRIQDKMDNTSFSTSILNQFINDGQRDIIIQSKPQFCIAEATYTTSQGTNVITTSATDVLVPLSMRLYTPVNYAHKLPYFEYNDVDLLYPNFGLLGTGPPFGWYTFNLVPYVMPNADTTYTLKSKYLQTPTELVNDSDVPTIPVTFSEILVLAGFKRALEHDDDYDQAQLIQQEIDSKTMDMNNLMKPQLGTPHIMRSPLARRRIGLR